MSDMIERAAALGTLEAARRHARDDTKHFLRTHNDTGVASRVGAGMQILDMMDAVSALPAAGSTSTGKVGARGTE